MSKVIVCRCEDVTLDDIEHTIDLGYASVEEVKRYTGLGTGPCQGRECMLHTARICGEHGASATPFTSRPPLQPTSLALFAGRSDDE